MHAICAGHCVEGVALLSLLLFLYFNYLPSKIILKGEWSQLDAVKRQCPEQNTRLSELELKQPHQEYLAESRDSRVQGTGGGVK